MFNDTIPDRSEVNEEFTWNLNDIFSSDDEWSKEYDALNKFAETFSELNGRLGVNAENLLEFYKKSDEADVRLSKLYGYASCKSDQDTGNCLYQDMKSKAVGVLVKIQSLSAFAISEIMLIPDEKLEEFYKNCPGLCEYKRAIYSIRRRKEHILSAECETLLASAGELGEAPEKIQSIFENADLYFPAVIDKNGKSYTLTAETFVLLLESKDRTLRKNTFEAYYRTIGQYKNTFAAMLDAQMRQLNFFARSRKYASTLEASLNATEVPVEVYTNLIEAVNGNLDKMYRYVALRKKLLNVDELHMYDVYTPVVEDDAAEISYNEAKNTVIEALSVLGSDYTDLLKTGFNDRWIDVYENKGKRGGAYSSGNCRPHPYVLLNHKNNLDSMFTVAHEMGHALHSFYSCKNQPVSTSDYVIFVAEVASTCNEVLLMKYLLNNTSDSKKRAYLINHFLDQFKGTLYRQTMFAEFELTMGKEVENGGTLTADFLCEKYAELNKRYFGENMVNDSEIALEWARIPHFYYNYYVFQYATGFSAAVAIADRILTEGKTAVEDYKRFLSAGSSTDPISLLKIAGVDMSKPEPVNKALKLFEELIEELEKI